MVRIQLIYINFIVTITLTYILGIIFILKTKSLRISKIFRAIILITTALLYFTMFTLSIITNDISVGWLHNRPINNLSSILFISSLFVFVNELLNVKWKPLNLFASAFNAVTAIMLPALVVASYFTTTFNLLSYPDPNGHFYFTIPCDAMLHTLLSLYGISLIKNKVVKFEMFDWIKAVAFDYAYFTVLIIHNFALDRSFGGFSFRDNQIPYYTNPSIYTIHFTDNHFLNALVYVLGYALLSFTFWYLGKKIFSNKINKKEPCLA